VGILERAANDGLIEDLDAVYAQIKALRFHISKTVLSESLLRHSAFKQRRT
jgi:predicted nucleic acid-binding protein